MHTKDVGDKMRNGCSFYLAHHRSTRENIKKCLPVRRSFYTPYSLSSHQLTRRYDLWYFYHFRSSSKENQLVVINMFASIMLMYFKYESRRYDMGTISRMVCNIYAKHLKNAFSTPLGGFKAHNDDL